MAEEIKWDQEPLKGKEEDGLFGFQEPECMLDGGRRSGEGPPVILTDRR